MNPRISSAEWQVLEPLWDRSPATAADIYAALGANPGWHLKTVNTFLARLVEKGVLAVRREGKSNVYAPLYTREQCVRHESETFLQRVFHGAAGPMLAHFCERADLTDADIARLRAILDERTAASTPKRRKK